MIATPMTAAATTQTAMATGTTGSRKPPSCSDGDCSGVAVSVGVWGSAEGAGVAWVWVSVSGAGDAEGDGVAVLDEEGFLLPEVPVDGRLEVTLSEVAVLWAPLWLWAVLLPVPALLL